MLIRLAWRNIWRNRRRTFITIASISLGLAFAIFFIAFGDGVYAQLIDDGARMQAGHITLERLEYRDAPAIDLFLENMEKTRTIIEDIEEVEKTKLIIQGQGVARTGQGSVGVAVIGVEPSVEASTSPLASKIISGQYLEDQDNAKVVIGSSLARRLHLAEGKKLVLTTNDISGALTEDLCRVAGIFETGAEEIDGYILQVPIKFLARLYNMPPSSATQLGVVLKRQESLPGTRKKIQELVTHSQVAVRPWQEIMPDLASYIKMDKGSNMIFQAILIFLILFTIFNTILMSVLERQKEFAILLAVGTAPLLLKLQLLLESFFLGLSGCILGLLIGGSSAYALQVYGFDITRLYSEGLSISGLAVSPIIHAKVTPMLLLVTGGLVLIATLLLTIIPMRRSGRINIPDTLR